MRFTTDEEVNTLMDDVHGLDYFSISFEKKEISEEERQIIWWLTFAQLQRALYAHVTQLQLKSGVKQIMEAKIQ